MRKSKKTQALANKRERSGKNTGKKVVKSPEIASDRGTSRYIKAHALYTTEIQETDLPERVIRRVHLSDNSHVDVKAGSMLSKIGYMGPLQNRYLSK